jgi:hypothetical protein
MAGKALPSARISHPGLRQTKREGLVLPVLPDLIGYPRRQHRGVAYDDYTRVLQPLGSPHESTTCVATDALLTRQHVARERRPLQGGMHEGLQSPLVSGRERGCTLLGRPKNLISV